MQEKIKNYYNFSIQNVVFIAILQLNIRLYTLSVIKKPFTAITTDLRILKK